MGVRAAAITLSLLVAGCSVILQTAEATQCATDRDCDANPSLRQRVCEEGFCVVPKAPDPVPKADGGEPCVSNELCTQANSGAAAVCTTPGESACTPWQIPDCPYVSGSVLDRNAIVIGTIYPFHVKQPDGRNVPVDYAERVRKAIDFARADFEAEVPGGIIIPGGPRRPFALVHCDSYLDPERTRAAMKHLTEVVGVQAIIVGGDEELAALSAQAIEKKTALVCSDCVAPFPPGARPWRIVPPLALQAPMAAWRVAALETEIKGAPNPPAALKVAVLSEVGRSVPAFVAALEEKLRFNEKSTTDNAGNYLHVKGGDPQAGAVDYVTYGQTIATFRPDVIVVAMGAEFPINYLSFIEAKWPADKPRPHYIVTERNYEVGPFAAVLTASDEGLRRRISGTRSAFDPILQANIDAFAPRFQVENNGHPGDGNYSGYDAFYATAYAIAAASLQLLVDGPHISAGFERLRGGDSVVDFRPGRIGTALGLLGQSTSSIDVRGLWSNLDWNITTHDFETDVSMFCFQRDPGGSLVIKPDAGPRLVTSTGLVSNPYVCD